MEERDNRADNPYTAMEGYTVYGASGAEIGEVESTVYDAPSVSVPFDGETVESAPEMEDPSGTFDRAVREHYGMED